MHRSKTRGYSITSSARPRSIGGTVKPRAVAAFKLITNSNWPAARGKPTTASLRCVLLEAQGFDATAKPELGFRKAPARFASLVEWPGHTFNSMQKE